MAGLLWAAKVFPFIGLLLDIDEMKINALFDNDGFPVSFFPDVIEYKNIPDNAVSISEAQWREFIEHAGQRKWENGEVVTYTPPPPAPVFPALSSRQFWQAALAIGVKEEDLIADIANKDSPFFIADEKDRESVLIDISKATTFTRDYKLLKKMAEVNKIPDEQLDTLWNWAATI